MSLIFFWQSKHSPYIWLNEQIMVLDKETQHAVDTLTAIRDGFRKRADKIDESIKVLLGDTIEPQNKAPQLNGTLADAGIMDKALAIIEFKDRFLTRREIEEIAESNGHPFNGLIKSTLSIEHKKEGSKLGKVMVPGQGNIAFWGLSEWVNEKEKVKPEYKDKLKAALAASK